MARSRGRNTPTQGFVGIQGAFRGNQRTTQRKGRYDITRLDTGDKVSHDILLLGDESLEETANLPGPGELAADIVEDLESALEQFHLIAKDLANPPP